MSDALRLTDFVIRGYRGIGHLHLPALGRVTLIAGKNNAGKTSVLEALRIFLSEKPILIIADLLRARSGLRQSFTSSRNQDIRPEEVEVAIAAVNETFFGYFSGQGGSSIEIGPGGVMPRESLRISLPWATGSLLHDDLGSPVATGAFVGPDTPLLHVERGGQEDVLAVDVFLRRYPMLRFGSARANVAFIPPRGVDAERMGASWGHAAGGGYSSEVEGAFRSIIPDLERLHMIGSPATRQTVAAQLRGTAIPVPIASMGDGANRVLGIALAMVQASGGAVLIDEIENGLHHTVQAEVWEAIFGLSERLNVQVVATTHSWDAVVGFQYAANRSASEGVLYRLDRQEDGAVRAVHYTERDVAIAAEQQIEVR